MEAKPEMLPQNSTGSRPGLRMIIISGLVSSLLTAALLSHAPKLRQRPEDVDVIRTFHAQHTVVFNDSPSFWTPEKWDRLVPSNGGFQKGGANLDIDGDDQVGISMFHQLHCLQMIREAIVAGLTNGDSASKSRGHSHHTPRESAIRHKGHVLHCVDYLAQVCCDPRTALRALSRL